MLISLVARAVPGSQAREHCFGMLTYRWQTGVEPRRLMAEFDRITDVQIALGIADQHFAGGGLGMVKGLM